jgi:hypothetical protein
MRSLSSLKAVVVGGVSRMWAIILSLVLDKLKRMLSVLGKTK